MTEIPAGLREAGAALLGEPVMLLVISFQSYLTSSGARDLKEIVSEIHCHW